MLATASCSRSDPPPTPRAQPLVGTPVTVGDSFSFLVGGHLYGFIPKRTNVPADTFVAAVDRLAAGPDAFFVSLGDFVYGPPHLEPTAAFLTKLGMPFYNTPGNHDISDRARYAKLTPTAFGCFRAGPAVLVLLDTEQDKWRVSGPQLELLRNAVAWVDRHAGIEHLLVFAHKLVFACDRPRYAAVLAHVNGRDGLQPGRCNFQGEVLPLLAPLAHRKDVVWFGGDVGIVTSLPLLLDRDPESNVTFVAVGLGNLPRDSVLRVHVAKGAPLRFERVPLGDPAQASEPLAAYGVERWNDLDR